MSVRMVDLDSSVDDVELVELDSSVELVELDSSVELVSVTGGKRRGWQTRPLAVPLAPGPWLAGWLGWLAHPIYPSVFQTMDLCDRDGAVRASEIIRNDLIRHELLTSEA